MENQGNREPSQSTKRVMKNILSVAKNVPLSVEQWFWPWLCYRKSWEAFKKLSMSIFFF